jgi:putative inorganic carbon (HCO3(-)) transporter
VQSIAARYTGTRITTATPVIGMEEYLALAYLFVIYSRLTELLQTTIGHGLFLAMLTMLGALLFGALKGGMLTVTHSFPGICWLLLTGWYIACVPFAFWPGGSVMMLKDMWIKSLLAFFVVAGTLSTIRQVRRAIFAIAGAILIVNITTIILGNDVGGRLGVQGGSLANANGLATHLMFGFPAILLLQRYTRGMFRWASSLAVASSAVAIFRTGSRSGLLMLGTVMVVIFFRASLMNKLKLFAVSFVIVALGVAMTSEGAWLRYLTMIDPNAAAQTGEGQSAIESRNARKHHILQSLRMTLERPIFGVGPGNFTAASADDSEESGERAAWRNTHNAYTQISSESGFPGLILFLLVIAYCYRTSSQIYREAKKRPEWSDIADIAFCFRLMMIIYMIDACFDSNAYLYHLPVFSALICAFDMAVRREMPALGAPQPFTANHGRSNFAGRPISTPAALRTSPR